MEICITQREGVRYFSRFRNIPDRDRIEIELSVDGDRRKVYHFDLTEALFEQFAQHPEILGKRAVRQREEEQPKPATSVKSMTKKPKVVAEVAPEPAKRARTKKTEPAPPATETKTSSAKPRKSLQAGSTKPESDTAKPDVKQSATKQAKGATASPASNKRATSKRAKPPAKSSAKKTVRARA
ncbi:MAG: hypothetical protein HYX78_02375 [Armatimonadetes bacterium]|nr:hypothetical protein [Armatimonadota bacterium]